LWFDRGGANTLLDKSLQIRKSITHAPAPDFYDGEMPLFNGPIVESLGL
jgi:hypothetical protein